MKPLVWSAALALTFMMLALPSSLPYLFVLAEVSSRLTECVGGCTTDAIRFEGWTVVAESTAGSGDSVCVRVDTTAFLIQSGILIGWIAQIAFTRHKTVGAKRSLFHGATSLVMLYTWQTLVFTTLLGREISRITTVGSEASGLPSPSIRWILPHLALFAQHFAYLGLVGICVLHYLRTDKALRFEHLAQDPLKRGGSRDSQIASDFLRIADPPDHRNSSSHRVGGRSYHRHGNGWSHREVRARTRSRTL